LAYTPKSNIEFWQRKLEGNAKRDTENQARLAELGWRVIVLWECEIRNLTALQEQLAKLLDIEAE
jgi:DNA mismatch endonuclease, patch repair protein